MRSLGGHRALWDWVVIAQSKVEEGAVSWNRALDGQ